MAAPAVAIQQASVPPPDVVGNAFVHQYYLILHQSPELVHRFYQDVSKLGRPDDGGIMSTTTTMHAINEKILSLGYGKFRAEISTVDSQESFNGGVLVLVTGYLNGNDNLRQKFTQSFFLAPQDNGYFVLNDVFRYVDDANQQNENLNVVNIVEAPVAAEQDSAYEQENHISEQPAALSDEANEEEVCDPSENEDVSIEEDETPVPEVVDEVPEVLEMADSQIAAESISKVEELPKKSYASIVKVMKENVVPFSSPAPSPIRSAPKSQEQVTAAVTPVVTSETHVSTSNATENANAQESEADGPSIYVKGLPLDATPSLLENEFKKFGSIRAGGIQVRCQKGFCFGFVEFEVASAVQSAIEASPIMIHGCRVVVEEKRSTSRGNHRGRFSSGAGAGYRNEGARGRGNFGGARAYGRGDFSNRTEYGNRNGNRGGFSNRGGDGFRRADKMGNNGGRASRASGLTLNAAAKTTAPRVSATA
ncbi:RNA binding protein, putative [Ricinus communis]|uniref:RNA binding protein, putative n=1 Tax=Ricinus communis TaxID=3988 RepID=B9T3B3_RICCO|nr:RNA binding protein, putative [Ricinus communis]|eukprot:XP_002532732.1 putative G3BP-like protein [Ricinus communis]